MKTRVLIFVYLWGSLTVVSLHAARPMRVDDREKVEKVAFCDLFRHPERYRGKVVLTKAILVENKVALVDAGEPFLYSPDCNNQNARLLVEYDQAYSSKPEVDTGLREIISRGPNQRAGRSLVVARGRFETSASGFGHLDAYPSRIVIKTIENAKDVRSAVSWPRETRQAASVNDAAQTLKSHSQILAAYYGGIRDPSAELDSVLADDFVLTDIGGESINKQQLLQRERPKDLVQVKVHHEDISLTKGKGKTTGLIVMESREGSIKSYRFTDSFEERQGRWWIVNSQITPAK